MERLAGTSTAELEAALVAAGVVLAPVAPAAAVPAAEETSAAEESSTEEPYDAAADDDDMSEGSAVSAFWGDDDDDDDDEAKGEEPAAPAAAPVAAPAVVRLDGARLAALAGTKALARRRAAAAALPPVSETVAVPRDCVAHLIGRDGRALDLYRPLRALLCAGIRLHFAVSSHGRAHGRRAAQPSTVTATARPGPWQARFASVIEGALAAYEGRKRAFEALQAARKRNWELQARSRRGAVRRATRARRRGGHGDPWTREKDERAVRRARRLKRDRRGSGGPSGGRGGKRANRTEGRRRVERRNGAKHARAEQRRYVDREHLTAIFGSNT